jgi:glycine/D-amino acid oxidase-like deaminating enzyme
MSSPDYDLIVVGSGFWGTAIALEARESGMNVAVIDDGNRFGASRAAAGFINPDWFKGKAIRSHFPADWSGDEHLEGFAWLHERVELTHTGELFKNLVRGNGEWKWRPGLWVMNSPLDLLQLWPEVIPGRVSSFVRLGDTWRVFWPEENGYINMITARKLVLATGAATDGLLEANGFEPVGVSSLWGMALIVERSGDWDARPSTIMYRPYKSWTVRPVGPGLARLGDTVEGWLPGSVHLEESKNALTEGAKMFWPHGNFVVHDWVRGARPTSEHYIVKLHGHDFVVASGGHRVGLVLAGAVAQKVVSMLS